MIAAAATHGDVTIRGCIPTHMEALTAKLLEMGVRVIEEDDSIRVISNGVHRAVNIKTQVYPGFPTDLQQPMSALLTTAKGESTVKETIYENRLRHLSEISRMGAKVRIMDRTHAMHYLRSDDACRNTMFNGQAQSAARYTGGMRRCGLNRFRIELLDETPEKATELIQRYRDMLQGRTSAEELMQQLNLLDRIGVTDMK
jgi:hypothetical protein